MPKRVDHDERRREILAALWRVVERDGVAAVTVRSVAAEAGLTKTMLGYYFDSQSQLLGMAVEQTIDEVTGRFLALDLGTCDEGTAVKAIMLAIPTTAERRRQAQVWLMLVGRRAGEPDLAQVLSRLNRTVRQGAVTLLTAMAAQGLLGAGRDLDLEAVRLHALVDGLSVQTLSDEPLMPARSVRQVVRAHVRELANPAI